MTELVPGGHVLRDLKGGETHSYTLKLKVDQFVDLQVMQKGADVVLRICGPDGAKLQEIDSPNGSDGPESLFWVSSIAGEYRVEVRSLEKNAPSGQYEIELRTVRQATEADRELGSTIQLDLEAAEFLKANQLDRALPLVEKAQAIREKFLPIEHVQVLTGLDRLSRLYQAAGENARWISTEERRVAAYRKALGPEHPNVAVMFNDLAVAYQSLENLAQAESLFQQALAIYEKTLGPEHREVSVTMNNLGLLYQAKGEYTKAETFFLKSLVMREKLFPPGHPIIDQARNNLGWLYREKGEYGKAEAILQQALIGLEKSIGPQHRNVAYVLLNLASVYQDLGNLGKSELLLQRALNIREKALGPDHPEVAVTLNNLGYLYREKGDYDKAIQLLERALTIYEKKLGTEHREIANSLNNIGLAYFGKKEFTRAEQYFQRAQAMYEKVLGPDHQLVARPLANLANVYQETGQLTQAEALLQRALKITNHSVGQESVLSAKILANAGKVSQQNADYLAAEQYFQQALMIWEKTCDDAYPLLGNTLTQLSRLYQVTGNFPKAIEAQVRANETRERDLARNLVTGSERQKLTYLELSSKEKDISLSLHLQHQFDNALAARMAFQVLLVRKGRALDAMTDVMERLRRQAGPEDQKLIDNLAAEKTALSQLTLRGPGKEGAATYRTTLQSLEAKVEQLEAALSARSAEYRVQTQVVTLEAVTKAIPADSVLVEYVEYRPFDAKTAGFGKPRYAAYVLDHTGKLAWADLGEAEKIEGLVQQFRSVLRTKSANLERQVKPAARAIDDLVMAPIRRLAGNKRHLLISPDGALNLVPFGALVDQKGRFLVKTYTTTYLTSGRDLLRMQGGIPNQHPPLVVASPDFGSQTDTSALESGRTLVLNDVRVFFLPLPGTQKEAQSLQHIFPTATVVTGSAATETALKQAKSPKLLHIATHGFFLPGEPGKPDVPLTTELDRSLRNLTPLMVSADESVTNPLLRSGLGLAGANLRKSGDEDGILTALEATGLDLWGTKLVVLSACDTGVGDVKNGEGVYGLRRALVLAGSESQVMSLWPVSDRGTLELMIGYYRNLLAGQGRTEALRTVQLQMLRNPRYRHPFYWASFIQSGAWGKLE
ncbi:MAG: CHAT domain-containing protein [Acidobacteria bacterium]|nr:CHAT domain-containing protein [Acidobacteriota bacterium]